MFLRPGGRLLPRRIRPSAVFLKGGREDVPRWLPRRRAESAHCRTFREKGPGHRRGIGAEKRPQMERFPPFPPPHGTSGRRETRNKPQRRSRSPCPLTAPRWAGKTPVRRKSWPSARRRPPPRRERQAEQRHRSGAVRRPRRESLPPSQPPHGTSGRREAWNKPRRRIRSPCRPTALRWTGKTPVRRKSWPSARRRPPPRRERQAEQRHRSGAVRRPRRESLPPSQPPHGTSGRREAWNKPRRRIRSPCRPTALRWTGKTPVRRKSWPSARRRPPPRRERQTEQRRRPGAVRHSRTDKHPPSQPPHGTSGPGGARSRPPHPRRGSKMSVPPGYRNPRLSPALSGTLGRPRHGQPLLSPVSRTGCPSPKQTSARRRLWFTGKPPPMSLPPETRRGPSFPLRPLRRPAGPPEARRSPLPTARTSVPRCGIFGWAGRRL